MKHPMKKRDRYLRAAICSLWIYCAAALVLAAFDKTVPDALTVAWFSAWTVELALVANIKLKDKGD